MTARDLLTRWRRLGLHPCLYDDQPVLLNLSGLDQAQRLEAWQEFQVNRKSVAEELLAELSKAAETTERT